MNRKQRQQNGNGISTPVATAVPPTPSIRPLTPPQRSGELTPAPGAQGRTANLRSAPAPSVEEIRVRAYEVYLERCGRYGTPESDWLQAEREVRERAGRTTT